MKESISKYGVTVAATDLNSLIGRTIKRNGKPFTWKILRSELWAAVRNVIADLYHDQGYTLTLRQLYYQLVARDLIPNDQKVYALISDECSKMRRCGVIDWDAIEDRNRQTNRSYREESVEGAILRTVESYRLDRQIGQPIYLEVMAEKDAVSNIVGPVCNRYGIPYTINRGYLSTSSMYEAYERIIRQINRRKNVKILYLGDHDPSGIQMRQDIRMRILEMIILGDQWIKDRTLSINGASKWAGENELLFTYDGPKLEDDEREKVHKTPMVRGQDGEHVEVQEWVDMGLKISEVLTLAQITKLIIEQFEVVDVALTFDQIKERNLPPNPAKKTDSRAAKYMKEFGEESWELDAIPPADMQEILDHSILKYLDFEAYQNILEKERQDIRRLKSLVNQNDQDDEQTS